MLRKFDTLSKDLERKCVDEVITRVQEIGDSEIGIVAAEDIISIVKQNLGPDIYNMGLHDAKKMFEERFSDISADIDVLEQHV